MKRGSLIILSLLLFCIGPAFSNVWIDENFDGTGPTSPPIWVQGDGGGPTVSPIDATLDIYVYGGSLGGKTITGSPLTQTGAKTTSDYFDGTASYALTAGGSKTISVGNSISSPANGAFVILQFAINASNVSEIGTIAEFRFNWDTDNTAPPDPDYSFYVKLVGDGIKLDIRAGEDLKNSPASEASIGSLNSSTDWKFITMVMQNNAGSNSYTHATLPGGSITQAEGVAFYSSNTSPGHFVAMSGNGLSKTYTGWSIINNSAALTNINIDTLYWEGGMDDSVNADQTQINIRPFDYAGSASSVEDWALY